MEDEGAIHVRKYFLDMLKSHIWAKQFGTYCIYIYTLRQKQIFIGKATDQLKNRFNRQRSGTRYYADRSKLSNYFHSNNCDFKKTLKLQF